MHVHFPKPLHGWREFVGEVGIIVIGVLIALGAEQVAEWIHWRIETAGVRESLHREIRDNLANAAFAVMISPCVRDRIRKLDDELRRAQVDWHADPVSDVQDARWSALPVPFLVKWQFYTSGHWQTAIASGASEHMSEEERNGYSYAYRAIEDLRTYAVQENDVATHLQPLAQDQRLDPRDRRAFESDLAALDRLNVLQTIYARKFLEGNRRSGIVPKPEDLQNALRQARADYGACVVPVGDTSDALQAHHA